MKNFLLFLAVALVGAVYVGSAAADEDEPFWITEIKRPDIEPTTNGKPYTQGWVDGFTNEVCLTFQADLGTVVVEICDMTGQVISRHTCNTSVRSDFSFPAPDESGMYIINIVNRTYVAEGRFSSQAKAW